MNEQKRYETVDMPFFEKEIRPVLPPKVLDFHTHVWIPELWKEDPVKEQKPGSKYMQTDWNYCELPKICPLKVKTAAATPIHRTSRKFMISV